MRNTLKMKIISLKKQNQNYQSSDWTQYSCIKHATNRLERVRIIISITCVKHNEIEKCLRLLRNLYACDRRIQLVTAREKIICSNVLIS